LAFRKAFKVGYSALRQHEKMLDYELQNPAL